MTMMMIFSVNKIRVRQTNGQSDIKTVTDEEGRSSKKHRRSIERTNERTKVSRQSRQNSSTNDNQMKTQQKNETRDRRGRLTKRDGRRMASMMGVF